MKILTSERTDGPVQVTVVQIYGDLDTMTFTELETKGEEIYNKGARRIVLDLSEVGHMSSAGLRAIHTIFNLLRSNDPSESYKVWKERMADNAFKSNLLKLVSQNQNIRQILITSGYQRFLEVHDTVDQAIQSFVP